MADEAKNPQSESEQTDVVSNNDYIEALKEMKQKTVAKEAYEKLQEENRKLLKSLINGETLDVPADETADIAQLRKDLYSGEGELSNLEYIQKTLQLRDAIIEAGGDDPFLPIGHRVRPTDEDIAAAERVAKVLKDCIEYADGDSSIFTSELQRQMVDTAMPKSTTKSKK